MTARNGKPLSRRATPAARGPRPAAKGDPQSLGAALSELFALKGYANAKGDAQLADAWKELAGQRIAERTAVLGVNRGVLQIGVASAALLGELASFHKPKLVDGLKERFPALKLRDIKFRLRGDLAKPPETARKGPRNDGG
ncbi:MAG TPA: DUF721 domain-containing protein [Planctomycetaceae bacterium]